MTAKTPRLLSRLVRVMESEIHLRAARHGQSVTLTSEDLEAIPEQVADLAQLPGRRGHVNGRKVPPEFGEARHRTYAIAVRPYAMRNALGCRMGTCHR